MRVSVLAKDDYARKRIMGKRVKNEFVAKLVAKDMLNGLSLTEICSKYDYKDRNSIYAFKELAINLKFLEITAEGKIIKPAITREQYQDEDFTQFLKDELVQAWSRDMQQRKAGKPIRSYKNLLSTLYRVSKNLKIKPSQFLLGTDLKEVLQNGREIMQSFKEEFEAGNIPTSRKNADISHVMYATSKAVRDFMNFHGYPYPKGEKGVMSQSVNTFRGKYADIKLTPEQIAQARAFIKAENGLDSDLFRAFTFGIESCSRKLALIGTKLDYEKIEKNNKTVYVMTVYEAKTQEIKGGLWRKYIMDSELQKSIDIVKKRGGQYLIEARKESDIKTLRAQLQEVYRHIKPNRMDYIEGHAFHCLRHFGAHFHLDRVNYNYAIVARLGGWNTAEELEKSYGEMPTEVLMSVLFQ